MQTFPTLPEWVTLEHEVANILTQQETHGWYFDERSAWELESTLSGELRDLIEDLQRRYPFIPGAEFTPKRNNKTQGYYEGCPFTIFMKQKLFHWLIYSVVRDLKPTQV